MLMSRVMLAELRRRCQKAGYRTSGNWMARHVSRPLALYVTWLVAPWGVSAHAMTVAALAVAVAAAGAFAVGSIAAWLIGAALLQTWYLLDHVDGQLARYHRTSSLDGVQLDYLMHHLVNLLVPWGVGYGCVRATGTEGWLLLGLGWSVGLLLLGLANDTRYKAFIARLKETRDELRVVGRAGARRVDESADLVTPAGYRLLRRIVWLARKLCEPHVVMNCLTAVSLWQWFAGDTKCGQLYLALMAPLALMTSAAVLTRDVRRGAAEQEFASWYEEVRS
jgi:hypothetical protein